MKLGPLLPAILLAMAIQPASGITYFGDVNAKGSLKTDKTLQLKALSIAPFISPTGTGIIWLKNDGTVQFCYNGGSCAPLGGGGGGGSILPFIVDGTVASIGVWDESSMFSIDGSDTGNNSLDIIANDATGLQIEQNGAVQTGLYSESSGGYAGEFLQTMFSGSSSTPEMLVQRQLNGTSAGTAAVLKVNDVSTGSGGVTGPLVDFQRSNVSKFQVAQDGTITTSLSPTNYVKTDGSRKLTGTATIPASDVTGLPQSPYALTVPPVLSTWTKINQGSALMTDETFGNSTGLSIRALGTASADDVKALVRAPAHATPYTFTAGIIPSMFGLGNNQFGIIMRETSTGKSVNYREVVAGGFSEYVSYYTDSTTYSGSSPLLGTGMAMQMGGIRFLRGQDDGANLIFSWSADGVKFQKLVTVGRTAFLAGGPDTIGFFAESAGASTASYADVIASCVSWQETTP